jgi:lipid A ethanolaminephosphotransferase
MTKGIRATAVVSTMNILRNQKQVTTSKLIILVSVFLIAFGNSAFFSNVLRVYPFNTENSLFLISLAIVFGLFIVILLSLVCYKHTTKPILITVILISSVTAYFMDSYNVVIDDNMIINAIETNYAETMDLISFKFFLYLTLLGIMPSILIYKLDLVRAKQKDEIISRLKLLGFSFAVTISLILVFGNFYASFAREHKLLRYYANPTYYIYSAGKYIGNYSDVGPTHLTTIGLDAKTPAVDNDRELIVFVVGETARADHFSLNGYKKKTNPYLEKQRVLSFKNVRSCGTATAESVPCMFSVYNRDDFTRTKAKTTENLLDVLQRAGVNVVWLDNNSDSKGVALRVPYEDYRTPDRNPVCDSECRDEGMLTRLQSYIDKPGQGDIFIVLHQMGNHGPAYYKRYPPQFEKFSPACKSNQLENCNIGEINNAYDNSILYTDYFLSKVIELLKKNSNQFEAALFYVSDHGESLGKYGLYLHGLPYMIAPEAQKRVPMIMWFSDSIEEEVNLRLLKTKINNQYSHDNIFHTVLGLFEINTAEYDKSLDIIDHEKDTEHHVLAEFQSIQRPVIR